VRGGTAVRADAVTPLARIAGPVAIAGGGLFALTHLALLAVAASDAAAMVAAPAYQAGIVAYAVSFWALLLALVAVYEREAVAAGTAGLVGFGLALAGTANLGGNMWFEAFAVPWLAPIAPQALGLQSGLLVVGGLSSYVMFMVGWVAFGAVSLRARVFPTGICVALVVSGIVGYAAGRPPYGVPLGLTVAALGVWLVRRAPAPARRAS
jgi:hypothetical protein